MTLPTEAQITAGAKALKDRFGCSPIAAEDNARAVLTAALAVSVLVKESDDPTPRAYHGMSPPQQKANESKNQGLKARDAAADLVRKVRSGELDPRKAATHLGLPFDQDIIMAILELAASVPTEEFNPLESPEFLNMETRRNARKVRAEVAEAKLSTLRESIAPVLEVIGKATGGPWQVSGVRHKRPEMAEAHLIGPDEDGVAMVMFDPKTGLGLADAKAIVLAINWLRDDAAKLLGEDQ